MFQLLHPELSALFPPLRPPNAVPNNLPYLQTTFIGREPEIADIERRLAGTRLLTLVGADGIGKTRLALQVAASRLETGGDGVYWVEFPSLPDPPLILQTLATILNVREVPGTSLLQTLLAACKPKKLLLVLDNCEPALTACAKLADVLIRHCPEVTLLACSREGLGIAGEAVYCLPPLALPDPTKIPALARLQQTDAVRLFLERTAGVTTAFKLTRNNASLLATLCQHLDGLPLAIELVAGQLGEQPFAEFAADLNGRFDALAVGDDPAPLPRPQILRTVLDAICAHLGSQERLLFYRLSVFLSGWTPEAAEAVAAGAGISIEAVPGLLAALAARALLHAEDGSGPARYRMREAIRRYAADRLAESGEAETLCRRHGDYFIRLAESAQAGLEGPEAARWLACLEADYENLRAALAWYQQDPEGADAGLRLTAALAPFWQRTGRAGEGQALYAWALARVQTQGRTIAGAQTLKKAGDLDYRQGDYAAAQWRYTQALAICRDLGARLDEAHNLNGLARVALAQGDFAEARRYYEQALQIFRERGDAAGETLNLHNLGGIARKQGELGSARLLYGQALARNRELGARLDEAHNLNGLARVALAQGDFAEARRYYEQALQIFRERGERAWEAHNLAEIVKMALPPDLFWGKKEI